VTEPISTRPSVPGKPWLLSTPFSPATSDTPVAEAPTKEPPPPPDSFSPKPPPPPPE
jgi:hypothetical protein